MKMKHWQDAANTVLGAWLVLSPWVIGFAGDMTATANFVIVGAALIAASLGAIVAPKAWEEWVETALGLWLCASPWALGYAALQSAASNAFLTGALIVGLALWVLMADRDFGLLRETKAT
jgi:hypothetical protein